MRLDLLFNHGLGDYVNFGRVLQLYRDRGFDIALRSDENKTPLTQCIAPGALINMDVAKHVPWFDRNDIPGDAADEFWLYNKLARNISVAPLPDIGAPEGLWQELCDTRLDLSGCYKPDAALDVAQYLRSLPRPIVLLHTHGNTNSGSKSVPDATVVQLYIELLDRIDGSIILLDWDDRVPRFANYRLRHLKDDWRHLDLYDLYALFRESDLLMGIDSGPLYFAQSSGIPIVGYYPGTGHYPSMFSLPCSMQVNMVPSTPKIHQWNRRVRTRYNIVESGESEITAAYIAKTCQNVLEGPKYLDASQIGADVQLQHYVSMWERGNSNAFTSYTDRHRSFDVVLRKLGRRFQNPLVVETGCIRSSEDWKGAGYGTYLLGAFVQRHGGRMISVDIDKGNCAFARAATKELYRVEVVCSDSVAFLGCFDEQIDLLVLDSMDTDVPGAEQHCLNEIQAAYRRLHDRSVVLFDDTIYSKGSFIGKGALAVPWLLVQGWLILYSGYQTVCVKSK
jgi:hypothetical protein